MLTLQAMILRLVAAVVLGAIVGLERETAHKQAGVRTDILVAAGAAIFSMIGLSLPYVLGAPQEIVNDILARNSGFLAVIANIVIGIGFLGAGIIVKQGIHIIGLTTAASVWFVAAVGVLCGIGLILFATVAVFLISILMLILRKKDFTKLTEKDSF